MADFEDAVSRSGYFARACVKIIMTALEDCGYEVDDATRKTILDAINNMRRSIIRNIFDLE